MHTEENRPRIRRGGGIWGRLIKGVVFLIVIAIAVWFLFFRGEREPKEKKTMITSAKLEEILQISDLSTYKVTFNGVAEVKDQETEELLYHVAYEATVSIGLDMEKVDVTIADAGEEKKIVKVILPEVRVIGAEVNPGTLDYIFEKSSANTDNVFKDAYPACRADAEAECKVNTVLYELARENAQNVVKALVEPLLEPYPEYTLELAWEGGQVQ